MTNETKYSDAEIEDTASCLERSSEPHSGWRKKGADMLRQLLAERSERQTAQAESVCDVCGGVKYVTRLSGPTTCWSCDGSGISQTVRGVVSDADGSLALFGHHPEPAIDFCVEVESILGEMENIRVGFNNGTPTKAALDLRIEAALKFRVGGDVSAVLAKQQLRAALEAHEAERMAESVRVLDERPYLDLVELHAKWQFATEWEIGYNKGWNAYRDVILDPAPKPEAEG